MVKMSNKPFVGNNGIVPFISLTWFFIGYWILREAGFLSGLLLNLGKQLPKTIFIRNHLCCFPVSWYCDEWLKHGKVPVLKTNPAFHLSGCFLLTFRATTILLALLFLCLFKSLLLSTGFFVYDHPISANTIFLLRHYFIAHLFYLFF